MGSSIRQDGFGIRARRWPGCARQAQVGLLGRRQRRIQARGHVWRRSLDLDAHARESANVAGADVQGDRLVGNLIRRADFLVFQRLAEEIVLVSGRDEVTVVLDAGAGSECSDRGQKKPNGWPSLNAKPGLQHFNHELERLYAVSVRLLKVQFNDQAALCILSWRFPNPDVDAGYIDTRKAVQHQLG